MTKQRILLYFGSFNPIHIGHLIIAQHARSHGGHDKLWFVVSPHNPLKEAGGLCSETQRKKMVEIAIKNYSMTDCIACDIEFTLPKPSYTIDTLQHLRTLHPSISFDILIGEDNLACFDKWKEFDKLLESTKIYVYSRNNSCTTVNNTVQALLSNTNIVFINNAPMLDISSSIIREKISKGVEFSTLVPIGVSQYITENGLYRTDQ